MSALCSIKVRADGSVSLSQPAAVRIRPGAEGRAKLTKKEYFDGGVEIRPVSRQGVSPAIVTPRHSMGVRAQRALLLQVRRLLYRHLERRQRRPFVSLMETTELEPKPPPRAFFFRLIARSGCGGEIMSGDDSTSANADPSVLANLRSSLVNAVGVTDFGDQAIILPLAVGIALVFALSGWRRGALAWAAAIGGTLALVLFLKLRFFACGHFLPGASLSNPSGHTAAAAAVYGGLVAMVMRSIWDNKLWSLSCAVIIAVFLAVVIGESRLILDLHSMAEVVVGGAIGVGGAVSFVMLAGPPSHAVRMARVVLVGLLVIAMLYGFRMPAEAAIKSMATNLWPFSQCI